MSSLYIALAVPFFFLLIAVELAVNRRRGASGYRFHDSITDLSCGVGSLVVGIFTKAVDLAAFLWVGEHIRVGELPASSILTWVVALFGVDLGYYVYHRLSHRMNVLWATHIAHHQSEEYNLAVALRQSWFASSFAWVFYLPLVVIGVPPPVVISMRTFNLIYQFWIHTEAVRRVGPLELFLNTPSHHRVHHGTNPEYIDRNYGGIFIIWDKLFGTFTPERDEVVYGLVRPLRSFNPLWANVHRFIELAEVSWSTRRLADKVKIWFLGPEWLPDDLGGIKDPPPVSRRQQEKYDVDRVSRGLHAYVGLGFGLVAVTITGTLLYEAQMTGAELAVACAFILSGLVAWGGLFEGRRWALPLEVSRWVITAGAVAWLVRDSAWQTPLTTAALVVALVTMVWVSRYRRRPAAPQTATA